MSEPRPLLSGRGLGKSYGAFTALQDVDFEVAPGEVKGLVGANGAGKSTLLKIIAGAIRPDAGELSLAGSPLQLDSMRAAARAGITLVSQELSLFPALSVTENLQLTLPEGYPLMNAARRREDFRATLDDLGYHGPLNAPLGSLTLGEQQLVEIARALLQSPRVLILDEPTSALQQPEKERLLEVIGRLRRRGVAILYVSHFLEELLEVADSLIVLRDGRQIPIAFAPSKARLPEVVAAMIGDRAYAPRRNAPPAPAAADAPALRLKDLRGPLGLRIDALTVPAGEVVGVTGLAGAGVEELFAILFGRIAPKAGSIGLPSGRPRPRSTAEAVQSGVAFIPADRKRIGLMLGDSIADNIASVRSLALGWDGPVLSPRRNEAAAEARRLEIGIKTRTVRQPVGSLSGGNQQKVVFAKWLEANPSLVLLDDPTRGVDIAAKREMHHIIRRLAAEGRVVLVNSSDPLELVELADRIHVFVDGEIRREIAGDELTEHGLVEAMNRKAG